ncbi:MAG: MDR family NADP-dependent oxidoreductase [Thermonemataceae bacterium]
MKWVLSTIPVGDSIDLSHFELVEEKLILPQDDLVLVESLLWSLDPSTRLMMKPSQGGFPGLSPGDTIPSLGIGRVIHTTSNKAAVGSLVRGPIGWSTHATLDANSITVIPQEAKRLEDYLSVLSTTGATAYFGLVELARAKKGESLLITAAAGAVGSIAGQIGKILGLRVVGITGNKEKGQWLVEELGFDASINYRGENVEEKIRMCLPDGIDIHFENVGAHFLQLGLDYLNYQGRIILCGLISEYNQPQVTQLNNLSQIIFKSAIIRGIFLNKDFGHRLSDAYDKLEQWLDDGMLKNPVQQYSGFENLPSTFLKLFSDNKSFGKLLVKV